MKCAFCSGKIPLGGGKMFVKSDGTVMIFCNSKCERNAKIRKARKVKWTETYRQAKKGRVASKKEESKQD